MNNITKDASRGKRSPDTSGQRITKTSPIATIYEIK